MTFPHRPVQVAGTAAAQGQPGPLKILVVEDDAAVRATLAAMLTKDGHRVTDAEDGAAAVLWLRQERFDVVLTDRAMPIMSGDELAVVVKARYPSTPVVMVTGAGEEMERQHLQPEGVDAILPKPVLRDDLRMALARVTGHGG
jgi:CheY-like chemotaxis protein